MAYILSSGNISPQHTTDTESFLEELVCYETNRLVSIEPNYSEFIDPKHLRRVARILKMALGAYNICMKNTGIENPDAIILGTGLGSVEHLEKFLFSISEHKEIALSPTPFIQSTHNMLASQIALMHRTHCYNMTYAHRAHSFESALKDALLLFEEGETNNAVVGGVDVHTPIIHQVYNQDHYWKKEAVNNLNLFESKTSGTIFGEGAAFFLLQRNLSESAYAKIAGLHTFNDPSNDQEIIIEIRDFLHAMGKHPNDITLLLTGKNGDKTWDEGYDRITSAVFDPNHTFTGCFKHLCGEYFTASAFALWLAGCILKYKKVPKGILTHPIRHKIENVLIYNHYRNQNHSLILLEGVE